MSAQIIPMPGRDAQPAVCERRALAMEAQIAASHAADLFQQLAKESDEPTFRRRAEVIRAVAEGKIMDAHAALFAWRYL